MTVSNPTSPVYVHPSYGCARCNADLDGIGAHIPLSPIACCETVLHVKNVKTNVEREIKERTYRPNVVHFFHMRHPRKMQLA